MKKKFLTEVNEFCNTSVSKLVPMRCCMDCVILPKMVKKQYSYCRYHHSMKPFMEIMAKFGEYIYETDKFSYRIMAILALEKIAGASGWNHHLSCLPREYNQYCTLYVKEKNSKFALQFLQNNAELCKADSELKALLGEIILGTLTSEKIPNWDTSVTAELKEFAHNHLKELSLKEVMEQLNKKNFSNLLPLLRERKKEVKLTEVYKKLHLSSHNKNERAAVRAALGK